MTDTNSKMTPKRLFYSYSHKDENLREELEEHLSLLRNEGIISEWHDRKIIAGKEWAGEIDENLEAADIILLLISASFNASDYCYQKEMTRAIERHDVGEAVVIPVILRECDWNSSPYGKLQALPKDGKPVTGPDWHGHDEAFTNVARGIREVAQEKTTAKIKGKIFDVPFRKNDLFTGREDELKKLREVLTSGENAALSQAIRGLGGIGKTQLAVKYAYQYQNKYDYVFWVQLSNKITEGEEREFTEKADIALQITNSYVGYCNKLQIPFDESNAETAIHTFKQWMEQNPNWLMIFDNADQPEHLKQFIPIQSQGHILLTSRANSFASLGIMVPIKVEKLSLKNSTEYLIKRVARKLDTKEKDFVNDLATEIDGLPLALEQAGAYIHESSISFERYLENYRKLKLKFLEKQKPVIGDYKKTVQTTWLMNYRAVKKESEASADVLRFSAFLAPDAIPYELISQGSYHLSKSIHKVIDQSDDPIVGVLELLRPLANYSLINMTSGVEEYSIHRLVQEVMKAEVRSRDEEQFWTESVVNCVNEIYPWPEHSKWQDCRRLSTQSMVALDYINQSKMETEISRALLSKQGLFFYDVGEYRESEPLYLQAMEIHRTVLEENHPDFANSLNNLAVLYEKQGRYAEAEPLYQQAMGILRTVLGENHPDFANSLNNLAVLYEKQGRYAESEPLYLQAMEIHRTVLEENHPDFANSLNNLAGLYEKQGRYAEAEPLYRQAMEIFRTVLGENHPDFANSLNNLAGLYEKQGRYAEAEPLYQQAMGIRRTVLGENHPDFATSLNTLAVLYEKQGRYAEAEPLYRQAMEIFRTVLGENHPDFATSLNNLAGLYVSQGRYAEAEPLSRQAIEIDRTVLGENHPNFATSLHILASLYQGQGRYAEAEPFYRQAIEIDRTVLGENHPDFATSLNNLAGLYVSQGRYAEAKPLYRQASDIFTLILGLEHPNTKIIRDNYQRCKENNDGNNEDTQ